jgi:hypothetical protein
MMISEARRSNLRITAYVDACLLPEYQRDGMEMAERIITVNLYTLIMMIGTIQTRRFPPSARNKFSDKSDLLDLLHLDSGELRVRIGLIQAQGGDEVLKTVSEDFGVGVSVVIALQLFGIRESTIERIIGHGMRPDWRCQTVDDLLLVVESKGASGLGTSNGQTDRALSQKRRRVADIRVASLTLIREHEMTSNRFLDPPGIENNLDPVTQRNMLRAGHYAAAFSFLGHQALSRYFTQMRLRIEGRISRDQQIEKDDTFFEIQDNYSRIDYRDNVYAGTFLEVAQGRYMFVGVDLQLVSYEGFLNFQDGRSENEEIIDENHWVLFGDGILLIEISNLEPFKYIVDIFRIPNYQQFISIGDVDQISEISFEKYWLYVLNRNGFHVNTRTRLPDNIIDIMAFGDRHRLLFDLKLVRKRLRVEPQQQLGEALIDGTADRYVLVTNAEMPQPEVRDPAVVLIARKELKLILKNPERLRDFLFR